MQNSTYQIAFGVLNPDGSFTETSDPWYRRSSIDFSANAGKGILLPQKYSANTTSTHIAVYDNNGNLILVKPYNLSLAAGVGQTIIVDERLLNPAYPSNIPFVPNNEANSPVSSALSVQGNVAVGTSPTQILPADSTRRMVTIFNRATDGTAVEIGNNTVALGAGAPIAAGASFVLNGAGAAGAIYGISSNANTPCSFIGA